MSAIARRRGVWLIVAVTILAVIVVFLQKPIPQDISYHNFCDRRSFMGIPFFADVISNLPFALIGIRGYVTLYYHTAPTAFRLVYGVVFTGILLTAFGSAWYHLAPDNDRLVFDRLPMTIVFSSLLTASIGEVFGGRLGLYLLAPLLALGIGSIVWWHHTEQIGRGDLRVYVLVQYYSLLLIPALLSLSVSGRQKLPLLLWALCWYLVAKALDIFDCQVYATLHIVSGHTLKHLAAAVSTIYIVKLYLVKPAE